MNKRTDKSYQRKGAKSNSHVGREFEKAAKYFFASKGLRLQKDISVRIGINGKKSHKFDLGNFNKKVLVECKSHKWTEGGNVLSAKMTTWDQAMYLFYASPKDYRKIFFVLRHYNRKRKETLADYYIRTNTHLIPKNVEIWEYDDRKSFATRKKIRRQEK